MVGLPSSPSESGCIRSCGFGVCHHISSFPCCSPPAPCLSPPTSGLSAGSGFSAKFGCFERNIVRNRDLRKVLIFRCLSNLSKNVDIPLSQVLAQLLWCSTARGTSCVSSWGHQLSLAAAPTPALCTWPHQTHRPGAVADMEVASPLAAQPVVFPRSIPLIASATATA